MEVFKLMQKKILVHTDFVITATFTPGSVKQISHNQQSGDEDMTNETENADVSDLTEDHVDGLFACPEQSCRKVYFRPHLLEYHICAGKHVYCNNENSYDKVKVLWSEKCVAVDHNFKVMLKSTSNIQVSLSEGWALKITKPQKRFSVRVKEFLHSIYSHCNSTGKRPNFDMVAADLKTLRNVDGTKKFNKDEWLTPSQIRGLFVNFVRFGNRNQPECPLVKIENLAEIKDDELQSTLEEMDSAEFHLAESDLSEDIITHFQ